MGGRTARQARRRLTIVLGLTAAGAIALLCTPPIPQPPDYHDFADARPLLGVDNGANVLSNAPFVLVGLLGLAACLRRRFAERAAYVAFFAGTALTGFGSAYYHLAPDNPRLVWDRLPMTISFAALVAATVGERVDVRWGRRLLAPLLVLGAASVAYWAIGDRLGVGDLRPYAFVQFASLLLVIGLALALDRKYTHTHLLWAGLGCYALAKLCEALDAPIFAATREVVSGHTLKHLLAALGIGLVARMIARRRVAARA